MLSIAIKNSVILALFILIAHFLLKNSAEDGPPMHDIPRGRPLMSPSISKLDPMPPTPLERRAQVTGGGPKSLVMQGDDLYSYVYGPGPCTSPATCTTMAAPPESVALTTPPVPALGLNEQIGGILAGYEGSSEQWADV